MIYDDFLLLIYYFEAPIQRVNYVQITLCGNEFAKILMIALIHRK